VEVPNEKYWYEVIPFLRVRSASNWNFPIESKSARIIEIRVDAEELWLLDFYELVEMEVKDLAHKLHQKRILVEYLVCVPILEKSEMTITTSKPHPQTMSLLIMLMLHSAPYLRSLEN